MIALDVASKEITEIIKKYLSKLEEKYLSVNLSSSEQGVFLTCQMENNENITLRAIEDHERKSFSPPMSSKKYQEQGGHQALIKKMQRTNPKAWKIEVKQTIKHQVMEIAFSGNEANWDPISFERDFVSTILKKYIK